MQTIRSTHNRRFFKISLVAFLVCLISSAVFLFDVVNTQNSDALVALDAMQLEAEEEATELARSLRTVEPLVEQIAEDLATGTLTVSEIDQRLGLSALFLSPHSIILSSGNRCNLHRLCILSTFISLYTSCCFMLRSALFLLQKMRLSKVLMKISKKNFYTGLFYR